jgi:hypothetical protein
VEHGQCLRATFVRLRETSSFEHATLCEGDRRAASSRCVSRR